MPDRRGESGKKHGDELESLIDRAASRSSAGKNEARAADDPTQLQDDDDEDIQNDDREDRRDVGSPH